MLTGKYQPGQPPPAGSRATDEKGGADMIKRFMNDDVLTRVQELQPIADELDLTMAQLAVAWVLANDNVAAALVGASRPEQVPRERQGCRGGLPPDVLTRIDEALGDVVERDPAGTAKNARRVARPDSRRRSPTARSAPEENTMPRAILFRVRRRGVLEFTDPVPEPGPGQVRVRVHASGVNPLDWKIRRGYMSGGKPLEEELTSVSELACAVDAVGDGVEGFGVRDRVGVVAQGTAAEYVLADRTTSCALPDSIDF